MLTLHSHGLFNQESPTFESFTTKAFQGPVTPYSEMVPKKKSWKYKYFSFLGLCFRGFALPSWDAGKLVQGYQ